MISWLCGFGFLDVLECLRFLAVGSVFAGSGGLGSKSVMTAGSSCTWRVNVSKLGKENTPKVT